METQTKQTKWAPMTPEEIKHWTTDMETDSHTFRIHEQMRKDGDSEEYIAEMERAFG